MSNLSKQQATNALERIKSALRADNQDKAVELVQQIFEAGFQHGIKGQKMNSIKLHSIAFAVILPCILALSEGPLIINLVGVLYILLLFRLSYTKPGKRFIRRYYKEILRLESLL